jgi:hypothetical protein
MTENALGFVAPLMGVLGLLFTVAWIISSVADSRRKMMAARARSELAQKILEKYGSGPEFLHFLQSDAGKGFLDTAAAEPNSAATRVLGSVQKGVIAVAFGLGLLSLPWLMGDGTEIFKLFGILSVSLGAGFLVSALLAFRLSRSLGLIGPAGEPARPRLAAQP